MTHSLIKGQPRLRYTNFIKKEIGEVFSVPLHVNPDAAELIYIIEGKCVYRINDKEYTADADSIVVFNRGVWHEERYSSHHPLHFIYLGFNGLLMDRLPDDHLLSREQSPIISTKSHAFYLKQRFTDMLKEKTSFLPESELISDMLLSVLLAEICRIIHHPADVQPKRTALRSQVISLVQKYIEEHYNQPITLEDISKVTYVSPYHICHIFKQETGISPIQYTIQYRMKVAMHYLTTTNGSVEEIAEIVGYSSLTSFHNIFRKTTGLSPGRYRTANCFPDSI